MATQEEHEGATPAGGVKSIAYYQDDEGRPAEKDQATAVEIVELDAKGNVVQRTYGRLEG